MPATKDEIKVIAQEVAEHYFGLMKEYVTKEVQLHTAQCKANKYTKLMGLLYSVIGGVLVGLIMWVSTLFHTFML
jgi:hypothetical protein